MKLLNDKKFKNDDIIVFKDKEEEIIDVEYLKKDKNEIIFSIKGFVFKTGN